MLCNSDEDLETEASYVDVVVAERMAGVVVAVASPAESSLAPLLDRRIPVVAVDRRPVGAAVDVVSVDNRLGAEEATTHLLAQGASRIACITGPQRVDTASERLQGYLDALAGHGQPVERSLIRRADFKLDGGYRAARSLLESPHLPDALLVANEPMTAGALRAIREVGLRVPDDVALVGFDDSPWMTLTSPALTVVSQPAYEIGHAAAELLASADAERPPRHVVLTPTLIVRESSEQARKG